MPQYIYGLDIAWCTGVAIYDIDKNEFVYIGSVDANKIKLKAKQKREGLLEHGIRLKYIHDYFNKLFELYPPSHVAIERYFARFKNSTITLAKIHGLINVMLHDKPVKYYPPKQVKEAILKGTATKEELQGVIKAKYNYIDFQNEDESDATAVALCHLIKEGIIDWN